MSLQISKCSSFKPVKTGSSIPMFFSEQGFVEQRKMIGRWSTADAEDSLGGIVRNPGGLVQNSAESLSPALLPLL